MTGRNGYNDFFLGYSLAWHIVLDLFRAGLVSLILTEPPMTNSSKVSISCITEPAGLGESGPVCFFRTAVSE
jgi:hypothetical protein